jgi:hypothetical protein
VNSASESARLVERRAAAVHERVEKMKHLRVVTKDAPISAYWWTWFIEVKIGGPDSAKNTYIKALRNMVGSLDPRDL